MPFAVRPAPSGSWAASPETVVGGDREVEEGPAVAVWLASLPQPAETFRIQFVRTSEGGVFTGYRFQGPGAGPYLLIGDPFSFPTDHLLRHLNQQIPGTVVMGGMASGGMGPGETRLFLDDRVVEGSPTCTQDVTHSASCVCGRLTMVSATGSSGPHGGNRDF